MSEHNGISILALDIETAPMICYAWGAKTRFIPAAHVVSNGHTICWAAKWLHGQNTMFRSCHHHGADAMVEKMWELLDTADAILTYNGIRFDEKRLNSEFIKRDMKPPSPYKHIDLFKTVKGVMALDHSGLDPVAKFLQLGEKIEHKGMELWKGCMAGNDADWAVMKNYNKNDVQLLIDCYHRLLPWIKGHPNVALYARELPENVDVCDKCGSTDVIKKGTEKTSVLVYQRYRCTACGNNMRGRYAIGGRANPHILRSA